MICLSILLEEATINAIRYQTVTFMPAAAQCPEHTLCARPSKMMCIIKLFTIFSLPPKQFWAANYIEAFFLRLNSIKVSNLIFGEIGDMRVIQPTVCKSDGEIIQFVRPFTINGPWHARQIKFQGRGIL